MDIDAFQNRLKKNQRTLLAHFAGKGVSCFRVYDRDLPSVPVALDWYEGTLVMHVFEPRHGISAAEVEAIGNAARLVLSPHRLVIKRRNKAVGGTHYDSETRAALQVVQECGHQFLINFDDHIDVGLFLDHRNLRARVQKEARGKDVLNLFAYTGSFSVYAAAGGARSTTTVDLVPRTVAWAKDNMTQNGFAQPQHALITSDSRAFLQTSSQRFDLVIVDPPTISKSKRTNADFDVQRDHTELLQLVHGRLKPGGVIYFSTNFTGFALALPPTWQAQELTHETVPRDFPHQPPIHRSFRIEKSVVAVDQR